MQGDARAREAISLLACRMRPGPVERGGDLVVVVLESVEALDDGLEAGEVVRGQHFALDDGEHDLDLVQPRGVERDSAAATDQPPTSKSRPTTEQPERNRIRTTSLMEDVPVAVELCDGRPGMMVTQ
jgi:hypothetical protein